MANKLSHLQQDSPLRMTNKTVRETIIYIENNEDKAK